jgi:hypothetical protein
MTTTPAAFSDISLSISLKKAVVADDPASSPNDRGCMFGQLDIGVEVQWSPGQRSAEHAGA